jgi:phosphatidylinositol alpha-1,6-mannosyltransferase
VSRYSRYQIQALREIFGAQAVSAMSLLGPRAGDFETPFDVAWHGHDGGLAGKAAFASVCIRNALEWRPRVIHAAHLNLGPLAKTAAALSRAKTIVNIYGREVWSSMSRWRRRALRTADRVIADCHFTADYAVSHQMHAVRPRVIWDCVDLDRFCPGICPPNVLQRYGMPSDADAFIIMTLGRLTKSAEHKGYDRLLRAFAATAPRCPKAKLVIAGSGDLSMQLLELARNLHIEEITYFTGSIDERDLPDVYRAASVFSLVSDRGAGRGEGIPLTPLEALACATPVIVGDQDGSQEAVIGGRNGIVCRPFDQAAQEKALVELYESQTLLRSMAKQARQIAVEYFGYDRFRSEVEEMYKGLTG